MLKNKLQQYGLNGFFKLFFDLINTKLFFKNARIVRLPLEIRGKKHIQFSVGLTTGRHTRIEAQPINGEKVLFIGKNVQWNDFVHITAMSNVTIGDNVLMASKIYISDCVHGFYNGDENDSNPLTPPIDREYCTKNVYIGNRVWIGESVSILPGVSIGDNSIIGANSVVTKSIPENSIAVGAPAKVIKTYNFTTSKWERIN